MKNCIYSPAKIQQGLKMRNQSNYNFVFHPILFILKSHICCIYCILLKYITLKQVPKWSQRKCTLFYSHQNYNQVNQYTVSYLRGLEMRWRLQTNLEFIKFVRAWENIPLKTSIHVSMYCLTIELDHDPNDCKIFPHDRIKTRRLLLSILLLFTYQLFQFIVSFWERYLIQMLSLFISF